MADHKLLLVNENIYRLRRDDRIVGFHLYDAFKEHVGRIEGLLVEAETHLPRYVVVTIGGFLMTRGKTVLIPAETCHMKDLGLVKTEKTVQFLQDLPSPHDLENVTREEEELILSYYDIPPYWTRRREKSADDKEDA
jgi:hypothetical protein